MHIKSLSCVRTFHCNCSLLKIVELPKRSMFSPLQTYCYVDLRTSLQHLLLDEMFVRTCSQWKSRVSTDNRLTDVYDGRIWKKFLNYNSSRPFLSEDFSYAFIINIDWFQPYKHLTYSVGVIYLAILNLPRSQRYQLRNICLVGIIPGPSEPALSVNQYIDPLVNDLLTFWNHGVNLDVKIGSTVVKKTVRCAVICCSCDLPAGRKLCGFLGHSAHFGCSKCTKYFPSSVNGLDYSGFQRDQWIFTH